jgi:hypothetical protein
VRHHRLAQYLLKFKNLLIVGSTKIFSSFKREKYQGTVTIKSKTKLKKEKTKQKMLDILRGLNFYYVNTVGLLKLFTSWG